ncbi:MAG TPA: hypothetical protein VLZ75_11215 [Chitinophagales bacterium]|nr:hypothetical protein [Chitinophagales bacterium]
MIEDKKPEYGVFIIESMDLDNEVNGKLDGYTLKTILDLCEIPNQYFYIRTKLELEKVIEIFTDSNFGFLHIACHGNENSIMLTFEELDFEELEEIIGDHLHHRRLFLSACKAARFELAEHFIPKYHCYSVIGTPENIDYDKAAVFWSSFYYLMFDLNQVNMPQRDLWPILDNVSKSFNLKLNYFSIINIKSLRSIDHLREFNYESGKIISDTVKKTKYKNIYLTE